MDLVQTSFQFFVQCCSLCSNFQNATIDEGSSSTSPQTGQSGRLQRRGTNWISDSLFKLYEPEAPHSVSIGIIFFHGLQFEHDSEGYLSTWRSGDALQEVWPQTWLPAEYPQARIISVSYDASIRTTGKKGMMDMHVIGENLLEEILRDRRTQGKESPVVLVGHSFGGLVIKQLCKHASKNKKIFAHGQDVRKFLESIRGIFFYGTPHHGFNPAVLWKDSMLTSMSANNSLLNFVEVLGKDAARLHDEFEETRRTYKWLISGLGELHVTAIQGVNVEEQCDLLVPEASSRYGDKYISVESDHFSICRPASKICNRYLLLVDLIDVINIEKSQAARRKQEKVPKNIVGLESVLIEVQKLLQEHIFLGFWGMGGVGKTTLARLAFNRLSATFEYTCFISEVKLMQGSKEEIKEKIWKNIRRDGRSVPRGEDIIGTKLLVVFDDIDKPEHVDILQEIADEYDSKESRFITTSRNAQILRLLFARGIYVYSVPFLKDEVAKELFFSHAFPDRNESPAHLKKKVEKVVEGCEGLPLTLEVLGKYLGGIKDHRIWDETLDAMRDAATLPTLEKVWRILQLSYDDLGDPEKGIFLDIASFFYREGCPFSFEEARSAWSSMYGYVHTRWKALLDRSLIQVEEINEEEVWRNPRLVIDTSGRESMTKQWVKVQMHEHLRRMGQKIASQRYISMIDGEWTKEGNSMQVEKVVALRVRFSLRSNTCYISDDSSSDDGSDDSSSDNSSSDNLSDVRFRLGKLGGNLSSDDDDDDSSCNSCKMQKFFSKLKVLRYLDLSIHNSASMSCERCNTSRGFSLPRSLVMFRWRGFNANLKLPLKGLVCKELVVLKLDRRDDCSLDILSSQGCEHLSKLRQLTLSSRELVCLPDAFGCLTNMERLEIYRCNRLESLPKTFGNLSRLERLKIKYCRALERLPETLGNLSRLEELAIRSCDGLKGLPETLGNLSRLERLKIEYCGAFERLPETLGNLNRLEELTIYIYGYDGLKGLQETLGNLSSLEHLNILRCDGLKGLPETLGNLSRLETLHVQGCGALKRLPETLGNLSRLEQLTIYSCGGLKELPETVGNLSRLERLQIHFCDALERLPETFGNLNRLEELTINTCYAFEGLPEALGNLSRLERLQIEWCGALERLPKTFGDLGSLKQLTIKSCHGLKGLPETLGNLSRLERLHIEYCCALERLPETLGNLSRLETLHVQGCDALERLPETLGNLRRLEELIILRCDGLKGLPETLGDLGSLKQLHIESSNGLKGLPETLGNLSRLEGLHIKYCHALERLPETLGNLSRLERLTILRCDGLKGLPETLENGMHLKDCRILLEIKGA